MQKPTDISKPLAKARLLTARQQQVLELIQNTVVSKGAPPTRAEIADGLGFRSINSAEDHLKALARKGVIELVGGTSRGIRLKVDVIRSFNEARLKKMFGPGAAPAPAGAGTGMTAASTPGADLAPDEAGNPYDPFDVIEFFEPARDRPNEFLISQQRLAVMIQEKHVDQLQTQLGCGYELRAHVGARVFVLQGKAGSPRVFHTLDELFTLLKVLKADRLVIEIGPVSPIAHLQLVPPASRLVGTSSPGHTTQAN